MSTGIINKIKCECSAPELRQKPTLEQQFYTRTYCSKCFSYSSFFDRKYENVNPQEIASKTSKENQNEEQNIEEQNKENVIHLPKLRSQSEPSLDLFQPNNTNIASKSCNNRTSLSASYRKVPITLRLQKLREKEEMRTKLKTIKTELHHVTEDLTALKEKIYQATIFDLQKTIFEKELKTALEKLPKKVNLYFNKQKSSEVETQVSNEDLIEETSVQEEERDHVDEQTIKEILPAEVSLRFEEQKSCEVETQVSAEDLVDKNSVQKEERKNYDCKKEKTIAEELLQEMFFKKEEKAVRPSSFIKIVSMGFKKGSFTKNISSSTAIEEKRTIDLNLMGSNFLQKYFNRGTESIVEDKAERYSSPKIEEEEVPAKKQAHDYLKQRRIQEFFKYLGALLVASKPCNPIEFLIDFLDKCDKFRHGLCEPPLLYDLKHIESLYEAQDPTHVGQITTTQYTTTLLTLGLTNIPNPLLNESCMVPKEAFIHDAYRLLVEQLLRMISIPNITATMTKPYRAVYSRSG